MKKYIRITLFVVTSVATYILLWNIFPKNRGILTFLLFNILLDAYLWGWVKRIIQSWKPVIRLLTSMCFWFPMLLLAGMVIYGFFATFVDWNIYIKTYVISLFFSFFSCTFFPIIFLLSADLFRLIRFTFFRIFFRRSLQQKLFKGYDQIVFTGWILGGGLFLLLVCGMIFWQYDFRIREKEIQLSHLPKSFDGIRIVQFSDIHLGNWPCKEKLEEAVRMINSQHPDIIFFTGDMFNYCTAEGNGYIEILKRIQAPSGVFAILGNHDYGDYIRWSSMEAKDANMRALEEFYISLNWDLLRNENKILHRGTDSIAIIGVENWGATPRFQRFGDISKAQQGTEGMTTQLLLSHDPSYWERVISRDYRQIDITFSGHTHGGQVGMNALGIHWSPIAWITNYWGGLYKNPDSLFPQYLYVDEGLGCIGYSGRVGILPEITVFVLKRAL